MVTTAEARTTETSLANNDRLEIRAIARRGVRVRANTNRVRALL
jgi:hypothetical protein